MIIFCPDLQLVHLLGQLVAPVTAVLTSVLTGDDVLDHLRRASSAPRLSHVNILP